MTTTASLLLVDDDRHLARSMAEWLEEIGYEVSCAGSISEAKACLKKLTPDLMLTDLRLGSDDGMDLIRFCAQKYPDVTSLVITGYATPETAVEAVRIGAFDVLTKPLIDEELRLALQRALSRREIEAENQRLRAQLDQRLGLENILSHDYRMLRIFDVIESVANARASILVTGENGTGKSMIARAIHRRSSRNKGPFIEVACGALPDALLESELFGHVAGAFTGANSDKVGKFKLADGGTLFLDEIGTASPALQVKLLRVLQELQFEPLGGSKTETVDVRVILATNENLENAVAQGRFRQDLYYRVNVVNIELPPLRERVGDIPVLIQSFLSKACAEANKQITGFDDEAMSYLQGYAWPGNVRELENIVQRAVLLGRTQILSARDLPPQVLSPTNAQLSTRKSELPMSASGGFVQSNFANPTATAPAAMSARDLAANSLRDAMAEPERQFILQKLRECHGNRAATAEALGINRTTLYKKMKRLGLDDPKVLYAAL